MAITRRQLLKRGSLLAAATPVTLNFAFGGGAYDMPFTNEDIVLYGERSDTSELGLAFRELGFRPHYAGAFSTYVTELARGKWIAGFTDEVGLLMLGGALQGGRGRLLAVGRHREYPDESEHWLQHYVDADKAKHVFALRQPDGAKLRWHLHRPGMPRQMATVSHLQRWQQSLGAHYAQLVVHAKPSYQAGHWQSSHTDCPIVRGASQQTISFLART
nr:hypothetical protein [uncultured Halomonas sp.]